MNYYGNRENICWISGSLKYSGYPAFKSGIRLDTRSEKRPDIRCIPLTKIYGWNIVIYENFINSSVTEPEPMERQLFARTEFLF
jgi:hypothetical protein